MPTLVRLLEQVAQHPMYLIKAFLALKSSGRRLKLLESCSVPSTTEKTLVGALEIEDPTEEKVLAALRVVISEEQSVTDGADPICSPRYFVAAEYL